MSHKSELYPLRVDPVSGHNYRDGNLYSVEIEPRDDGISITYLDLEEVVEEDYRDGGWTRSLITSDGVSRWCYKTTGSLEFLPTVIATSDGVVIHTMEKKSEQNLEE